MTFDPTRDPVPMTMRDPIAPHISMKVAWTMRKEPRNEMTTGEAEAYARGRAEALAPLAFGTAQDAAENLTGAIIDAGAAGWKVDAVSQNTLARVLRQLLATAENARAFAAEAGGGADGSADAAGGVQAREIGVSGGGV